MGAELGPEGATRSQQLILWLLVQDFEKSLEQRWIIFLNAVP